MAHILQSSNYNLARSVNSKVPKERWVASLSNGETIHENHVEGFPSAWERLKAYCEDNNLSITNLRLLIANTEVKLPSGQEGYLQKKIAWTNMVLGGVRKCIGYVQNGLSLIYEISSDGDSIVRRGKDPGEPFVIYRKDIRDATSK